MSFSLLQFALWAANSVLNIVLLGVLFGKRRWRVVPWLTAWMSYDLLFALLCFLSFRSGSRRLYTAVYWGGALIDFVLQIAVVVEIARSALKRNGEWVEGARGALLPFVLAGPIFSGVLALAITPAARSLLDQLAARANLFSTVLVCFLFLAVLRATQQLGFDWRSYTAREGLGLTIWTVGTFTMDSLHAYWRTAGYFGVIENTKIAIYQGVLLFWCIAFWLPEPERQPMPSGIKDAYHKRLQG